MDFKFELKQYKELVDTKLQEFVRNENCLESVLNKSVAYSLISGGKRLRPILMFSTYKLFKEDFEKCYSFAFALEMIHNFSLIHDDLPAIDNDDFRHGKLTNHKKFNEATAILAGDALMNYAYITISEDLKKTPEGELKNKLLAFNEFTIAVDRMIAGEYVDTEFEKKDISKEDLEYIHNNKTGALLKACVRIGAILADATDEQIKELSIYADKIGLAFQIKDDILSETADEKILGKPVGNDREKGKCTFVTKYGLDTAKKELNKVIDEAVEIMKKYKEKGEFLVELALYIKNRDK